MTQCDRTPVDVDDRLVDAEQLGRVARDGCEGLVDLDAGPLLGQIDIPADLKKLDKSQLQQVCNELRQFIIDCVSVHGGHFGASLGVVELTVALHYVFNTPDDQLVWDVGHQAYGHKILTGRRKIFHTNRKYGGLSGFPKRSESEYDTFRCRTLLYFYICSTGYGHSF